MKKSNLLLVLSLSACQSTHVDNIDYSYKQLYQLSIEELKKIADQGDENAIHWLSIKYCDNEQAEQAVEYLEALATKKGVNINCIYNESIKYYQILAKNGDIEALENLAYIYEEALDNKEKALEYHKKAYSSGHGFAAVELGTNEEEQGNFKKAVEYYNEAIKRGANGYSALARIYSEDRNGVSRNLEKSRRYSNISMNIGKGVPLNSSPFYLGKCEEQKGNFKEAVEYYKEALKSGDHTEARNRLAKIYLEGRNGIPIDIEKANKYR